MKNIEINTKEAIALLKALIETPSFSSEEEQTALLIENWFTQNNIPFKRENNNVWAFNKHFDATKRFLSERLEEGKLKSSELIAKLNHS